MDLSNTSAAGWPPPVMSRPCAPERAGARAALGRSPLGAGLVTALASLFAGAGPAEGSPTPSAAAAPAPTASAVDVGGALRFNYFVKSWAGEEGNRDRWGDVAFDMLRLDFDARRGPLRLSSAYRIYGGYSMLEHGYIGWHAADWLDVQVGLALVPFGILPNASHCWWFDLGFYLGFEKDLDLGVKGSFDFGPLDVQLGLYKNDDGQFTGSSQASARYSYDVVPARSAAAGDPFAGVGANRETNQVNLRGTYTIERGPESRFELGLSGQAGQLYNEETRRTGAHGAVAGHVVAVLGAVDIQLLATYYTHAPANPEGSDERVVIMGAFDAPYRVAARGMIVHANVAYTIEPDHPVITEVSFYDDYSAVLKREDAFADSHMNVLGVRASTHHMHVFTELALARNHPWIGPDTVFALAEGEPDAAWHARFNINLGYYF